MPQAVKTHAYIKSISARLDKSLRLSVETPELSSKERGAVMDLQGINLDLLIKPLDSEPEGIIEIDKELEQLSSSQRFRKVLFLVWKQYGEEGDFNTFYRTEYEKIINHYKGKLEN